MQTKRTIFGNRLLPYALLAPQLAVTLVFFIWPAAQAMIQSFQREDAFGLSTTWVWFDNYRALFADPTYLNSLAVTAIFAPAVTLLSVGFGLVFAVAVDRLVRAGRVYSTLLVWPYAVAPAVGGIMWWFLFNPSIGLLPYLLGLVGYHWDHSLNPTDAMILVVIAATWKQVSYNFLFFLAGLQAIPHSMIEAAAIDGAGPVKRFFTIVFPLLSPTSFFLAVINLVYAMFDTFPVIHSTTAGNPAQSTNILVFKVFNDGFIGLNIGSSAAQSVVLMIIVVALTVIQFNWVERKVSY